jgi:hypothetical protein
MPAFGPTHTDPEIWSLVDVVRRLPEMTPEEYQDHVASSMGTISPGADSLESSIEHPHAPGHVH